MAFLGYYVFRSGPLLLKSFNHWFIAESKGVDIPKSEQALNHRFIAVEPHYCVDSVLNCIHINLVLSCSNYFQLGSCLVWMHNVTRSSIRLNNVFHLWRSHRCLPKKQRSILVHALWYTAFLFRNTQQRGFEDKTENSALLKADLNSDYAPIFFSLDSNVLWVPKFIWWVCIPCDTTWKLCKPVIDIWLCGIIWGRKPCLLGHLSPCRADSMICPFCSREHHKMLLEFLPWFQWMKRGGSYSHMFEEFILRLHAA